MGWGDLNLILTVVPTGLELFGLDMYLNFEDLSTTLFKNNIA